MAWIPSQETGLCELQTLVGWRINIRHTHKKNEDVNVSLPVSGAMNEDRGMRIEGGFLK